MKIKMRTSYHETRNIKNGCSRGKTWNTTPAVNSRLKTDHPCLEGITFILTVMIDDSDALSKALGIPKKAYDHLLSTYGHSLGVDTYPLSVQALLFWIVISRFPAKIKRNRWSPLEKKRPLLPTFLNLKGTSRQHIDYFNYLVSTDIQKVGRATGKITSPKDFLRYHRFQFVAGVRVIKPPEINDTVHVYGTLHKCKLHNTSYSAIVSVEIGYTQNWWFWWNKNDFSNEATDSSASFCILTFNRKTWCYAGKVGIMFAWCRQLLSGVWCQKRSCILLKTGPSLKRIPGSDIATQFCTHVPEPRTKLVPKTTKPCSNQLEDVHGVLFMNALKNNIRSSTQALFPVGETSGPIHT